MIADEVVDAASSDEPAVLPASYAQELMFLMHRADPDDVSYNVPRTYQVGGVLDPAVLQRALDALVERHEILRTAYGFDGDQIVQIIFPPRTVPMESIDVREVPAAERDAHIACIVRERAARPFDLMHAAPFRVTLIRRAETAYVLQIATHHIASDGWSGEILVRDLAALYDVGGSAAVADLPALAVQYGDYAAWEREYISGERLRESVAYWHAVLCDAESALALPFDFPRPARPSTRAVSVARTIPGHEADAIAGLAHRYGATLYMTLLAAYQTVLHRASGSDDVSVGSPLAGRSREETHATIGYFANTVVQRARFSPETTFATLLASVRTATLGAYEHQEVPFEKLMLELLGRGAAGRTAPFNAVFTMLTDDRALPVTFGECTLHSFADADEFTKFDLTLFAAERRNGIELTLRGRADLFRAETLDALLQRLTTLLLAATQNAEGRVDELAWVPNGELEQLARWNATDVAFPHDTVVAMIEAAARRVPEADAVRCAGRTLSYRELMQRSDSLARRLRSMEIGRGSTVAIVIDRSIEMIVAFVGVLKVGAAYVPLDLGAPHDRLRSQMTLAHSAAIVTVEECRAAAFENDIRTIVLECDPPLQVAASDPVRDAAVANDLAYILFTSGSTGEPKGVAISHGNLAHYVRAITRVLTDGERDGSALSGWRFGMVSSPAADLGNTALFPALCAGATLVLIPTEMATDPVRFADSMMAEPLDVLKITPAHLAALLGADMQGLPKKWLVFGGEPLPWKTVDAVLGSQSPPRILNHYGPTEATVGAATFEVTPEAAARVHALGAQTVPIGTPLANVRIDVLDAAGQRLPIGIAGEAFISGAGVANGYCDRPAATAERFVAIDGIGRGYRSGDRVRRLASGELEFLGRFDRQVKVRGFRVELGEIEAVLMAHASIAQAVVIADDDGAQTRIAAYIVPATKDGGDIAALARAYLATQLPEYMVPSIVIPMDALPLTMNGKIDRAAFPLPAGSVAAPDTVGASLEGTELALATIWQAVLQCDRVTASDDFFERGGHSLLAIRILGKIYRAFGVRLPLRSLFDTPVLRDLAAVVDLEVGLAAINALTDEEAAALLSPPDPGHA